MFYQIAALSILLIFYSVYLLKMFQQKKKGIITDQMGKGKIGLPKWIEIIMKISTYTTVLIEVIMILLNQSKFNPMIRDLGIVIGIIGLVFFILSITTMKDSWRAGVSQDETRFICDGIFQYSRNPAFLGFDLVYISILLMFYHPILFLSSLLSMIMLHLQIVNNEEPYLLETFNQEYIDYCKKVNRYIGRKL